MFVSTFVVPLLRLENSIAYVYLEFFEICLNFVNLNFFSKSEWYLAKLDNGYYNRYNN